jgi:hypothetical protein
VQLSCGLLSWNHYKNDVCFSKVAWNKECKRIIMAVDVFINSFTNQIKGPGQLSRYSDLLRAGWSGDRILVGARFSAPVQTCPGAYPASCTMGTGSFPGVKQPGRGVDHPRPSSAEVKERVQLYLYYPSGPSWPVLGRTLPLP